MIKTKIALISLGCDKNRVDIEKILSVLSRGDFVISQESDAEIIIINTCAFILDARREAIDTILRCIQYKKDKLKKLFVIGCLAQKYKEELEQELVEVDAFLTPNQYGDILNIIDSTKEKNITAERVLTTPYSYAYLKISDGCDNFCTYCLIPSIKGGYKSTPMEDLIKEAKGLINLSIKEIILIGQDVTNYGIDLYKKRKLTELIRELSKLDIDRIRLMYCYPDLIDDELINEIRTNEKVVKYLDIPLQHIDDNILKLMGRKSTKGQIISLIDKLRREIPDIALRSTFITGFPSESDEAHQNLKQFIAEYKLNHAGFFCYSDEDTPSKKIKPKISKRISKLRQRELFKIQQQNVLEFNRSMIGKTVRVLYEGIDYNKKMFFGRAYFQAPEIDTLIYFTADFVDFANTYDVKITSYKGYDLIGKKV